MKKTIERVNSENEMWRESQTILDKTLQQLVL